jgi:hypothetical protein
MTKPNSSFVTFNYGDKIVGQAWVWYDKNSKTICLDNIEIPDRYSNDIRHNEKIKENFIQCLFRVCENFKLAMREKGFKVDRITQI